MVCLAGFFWGRYRGGLLGFSKITGWKPRPRNQRLDAYATEDDFVGEPLSGMD